MRSITADTIQFRTMPETVLAALPYASLVCMTTYSIPRDELVEKVHLHAEAAVGKSAAGHTWYVTVSLLLLLLLLLLLVRHAAHYCSCCYCSCCSYWYYYYYYYCYYYYFHYYYY